MDGFLTELQRLALLVGEMPIECWIRRTFVNGLPQHIRGLLRSSTRMEELSMQKLLERARAILIDEKALEEPVAALRSGQVPLAQAPRDDYLITSICFRCGGPNHLAKNCLTRNNGWNHNREVRPVMRCYRCGKARHVRRNCPGNRAGDEELVPASAPNKT